MEILIKSFSQKLLKKEPCYAHVIYRGTLGRAIMMGVGSWTGLSRKGHALTFN